MLAYAVANVGLALPGIFDKKAKGTDTGCSWDGV